MERCLKDNTYQVTDDPQRLTYGFEQKGNDQGNTISIFENVSKVLVKDH